LQVLLHRAGASCRGELHRNHYWCRITHFAPIHQARRETGASQRIRKAVVPQPQHGYTIRKKDRNWAVIDPQGHLVCLTVYKRGAVEVVRRLAA
jgi:hypothetical protein